MVLREEVITTRRGPLCVVTAGSTNDPAVLWLHGYTLSAEIWPPLWSRLPGFRHVGVDLPGHGGSYRLGADDPLATWGEGLATVADHTGCAVLFGLSFGGAVALEMAAADPGRWRRIVLSSPGLIGGPEESSVADLNQALIRLAAERGPGPWLADLWLAEANPIFAHLRGDGSTFAALEAIVRRHRFDELRHPLIAPSRRGVFGAPGLERIAAPIEVLVGEHDLRAFVRTAEIIRRQAPRATIAYVADGGHLAPLEAPDRVGPLIAAALDRSG